MMFEALSLEVYCVNDTPEEGNIMLLLMFLRSYRSLNKKSYRLMG